MIQRRILPHLAALARGFPVVTVTGPRQSGKTTLCRTAFPEKPYVNLEDPAVRSAALAAPTAFLDGFPDGAVLDEIQHVPLLLSAVQARTDESRRMGEFVLTGSQHLTTLRTVSQSLAGRTAVLHLLPLCLDEIRESASPPADLWTTILRGGYPAIHDRPVDPWDYHAAYTATYVERDVRATLAIGDAATFGTFIRLCAGRTAQLFNASSLGGDCGISHVTAKSWLAAMETGFLCFRLPPFARNVGKRLTKMPKLHLYDTGLACYLLNIRDADDLVHHPLRGAIFETWVVTEIVKAHLNRGVRPRVSFYRDHRGEEVDLVVEAGLRLIAVEAKSGTTPPYEFFAALGKFAQRVADGSASPDGVEGVIVHGGDATVRHAAGTALPWSGVGGYDWVRMPGDADRVAEASPVPTIPTVPPRAKAKRRKRVRRRA